MKHKLQTEPTPLRAGTRMRRRLEWVMPIPRSLSIFRLRAGSGGGGGDRRIVAPLLQTNRQGPGASPGPQTRLARGRLAGDGGRLWAPRSAPRLRGCPWGQYRVFKERARPLPRGGGRREEAGGGRRRQEEQEEAGGDARIPTTSRPLLLSLPSKNGAPFPDGRIPATPEQAGCDSGEREARQGSGISPGPQTRLEWELMGGDGGRSWAPRSAPRLRGRPRGQCRVLRGIRRPSPQPTPT